MKLTDFLIAAIMLLITIQGAVALDCYVDHDPFITLTTPPSALCIPANQANNACITWLSNPDEPTEIWGVMPEPSTLQGVGAINSYRANEGSVVVEFSTRELYDNRVATGNVRCGDEDYSFNFTAHFLDYDRAGDAMVWTTKNIGLLVFAGIILFLILAVFIIPVLKEWFRTLT